MLKVYSKSHDSGFVNQLAKRLKDDGFNVITNIGSSVFKIDLGITNPKVPSEYVLGVLCDGQNYKDSKTAKDREIIQPDILNQLGWNIHKVWSCDWWDNSEKVLKEIQQAIQNVNRPDTTPHIPETQQTLKNISWPHPIYQAIINNNIAPPSKYKLDYNVCEIPIHSSTPQPDILNSNRFKDIVSKDLLVILEKEAPISKSLLCHRILASWSISRLGSRIDSFFNTLFKQLNFKYTDIGRRFYWNQNQSPDNYINYRVSKNESQRRDASDISPEEVSNAVHGVLENMISLNKEDLIKETAKIFGFSRIGGNVESSIVEGINKAVKRGFASIEGDRVFLIE